MRIRTLFLIKVVPISDHWSIDPPLHHFKPHASFARVQCSTALLGSITSLHSSRVLTLAWIRLRILLWTYNGKQHRCSSRRKNCKNYSTPGTEIKQFFLLKTTRPYGNAKIKTRWLKTHSYRYYEI
jgi:hypothetical protein